MLKIIDSIKINESRLIVDEYVPFSFDCFEVATGPPIIWQVGNLSTSLIELKINPDNGAIYKVIVILLPKISKDRFLDAKLKDLEISIINELPICDTRIGKNSNFIQEKMEYESYINNDSVIISLENATEIKKLYKIDRITFGVNSTNEICLFKFFPLEENEIRKILTKVGY